MEIRNIAFEEKMYLIINNQEVEITPFLTDEYGNIKWGFNAPKGISVDREEVHLLKKQKEQPPAPAPSPSRLRYWIRW